MNWSHLMCMSTWMGQVEYPKSNLPYGWRCTLNKWLIRWTRYQIPSTLDFGSWVVTLPFYYVITTLIQFRKLKKDV